MILLVGYTEIAVLFNQQSGEITSALAAREAPRFRNSILVFFALPAFVKIFAEFRAELPLSTRILIAVVNFSRSWGLVIGAELPVPQHATQIGRPRRT